MERTKKSKRAPLKVPATDRNELMAALRWARDRGLDGLVRFYEELRQVHRVEGRV